MSKYTDAVEYNLKGLRAVSTGICPGCEECMRQYGFNTLEELDKAWERGKVIEEGSFSWSGCGICDQELGGDRYVWHALYQDGGRAVSRNDPILHFDDACTDCVMFLANGDEPDEPEEEEQEEEEDEQEG